MQQILSACFVDNIVAAFDKVQIPNRKKQGKERRRWRKTHLHAEREGEGGEKERERERNPKDL